MTNIIHNLTQCGIIQFGLFDDAPIRMNFKLLVSYPELLAMIADSLSGLIDGKNIEKLLCRVDVIALSALISQKQCLPLVYTQERHASAAHDLVGAYDVGHPTTYICNLWDGESGQVLAKAEQGGLRVEQIICIVQMPSKIDPPCEVSSLWTLGGLVEDLHREEIINDFQARLVMEWSESRA